MDTSKQNMASLGRFGNILRRVMAFYSSKGRLKSIRAAELITAARIFSCFALFCSAVRCAIRPNTLVGVSGGREKVVDRERYVTEQRARVFVTARGAFLIGDAVVEHRDEKLGVSFELYDRELSEGHEKLLAGESCDKLFLKALRDFLRDVARFVVTHVDAVGVADLHRKHKRIDGFDDRDGQTAVDVVAQTAVMGCKHL